MTKLRVFIYCMICFVCGMFFQWTTWQMAFFHGSVVRGAQAVADERDFWSAIEAKVPYERNGYRFCPHTHNKEVRVDKPDKPRKKQGG